MASKREKLGGSNPERKPAAEPAADRALPTAQQHVLAGALMESPPMAAQRRRIEQSFGADQGKVVQGYFTDSNKPAIFPGQFLRAAQADVQRVANYIAAMHTPEEAEVFNGLAAAMGPVGDLHAWIGTHLGTTLEEIRIWEVKHQHPQTGPIPNPWMSSTSAHNPGGPPIIVTPSELGSPGSSQEQDIHVEDDEVRPTDTEFDATQDSYTYHRNNQQYPVTPTHKSEYRASAMLTNSYVDYASSQGRSLVGKNTEPIKKETSKIRETERKRAPYGGKVLSHHPDTFWTGAPHSEMGFHPVEKTTNTLEGDAHDLSARTGTPLTGMLVRESGGLTRPTLEAHNAHTDRQELVDEFIADVDASDELDDLAARIAALRRVVDEAKHLAVTAKAKQLWESVHNVLDRLEIEMDDPEEERASLGSLADIYLEQTYDRDPRSTSTVQPLLDRLASALRALP